MAIGIFLSQLGLSQYSKPSGGTVSTAGQPIGLLLALTKAS
jgi:hypothetical protein